MIRIVVVDDEPVARRGLIRLLRDEPELTVVGEAIDGAEALEVLRRERPDVVLLDIQMPEVDGVAVASALEDFDPPPLIVFVTAYDEYAVRAFEVDAVDYLLKPFDRERLHQVMERVRRRLRRAALEDVEARFGLVRRFLGAERSVAEPERLLVREGGAVLLLRPDEADWIEAAGNYVRIRVGRRNHLARSTLGAMERRLEPHGFLRIGRSVLVNLHRVRQVRPQSSGTWLVELTDGTRLPVSRRYAPALRRAIERLQ